MAAALNAVNGLIFEDKYGVMLTYANNVSINISPIPIQSCTNPENKDIIVLVAVT